MANGMLVLSAIFPTWEGLGSKHVSSSKMFMQNISDE
jgi:hypothetical protein